MTDEEEIRTDGEFFELLQKNEIRVFTGHYKTWSNNYILVDILITQQ